MSCLAVYTGVLLSRVLPLPPPLPPGGRRGKCGDTRPVGTGKIQPSGFASECARAPVIALFLGHSVTPRGHGRPYPASPWREPRSAHGLGQGDAIQRWVSERSEILPASLRRQNVLAPPRKLCMNRVIRGYPPPHPLPYRGPHGKLGGRNDGIEGKAVVVSRIPRTVRRKAAIRRARESA